MGYIIYIPFHLRDKISVAKNQSTKMNFIKQKSDKQNMEKTFEELQKSEKKFKLGMAVIFLVVCFAILMIILGILSSL
jgi:cell division protein FtsL